MHNIRFNYPIVLKLNIITAVLCAKFQEDCTSALDVKGERDFARFEFKMSFGRISYIAQHLRWIYEDFIQPVIKDVNGLEDRKKCHVIFTFDWFISISSYIHIWINVITSVRLSARDLQGPYSLSGGTSYCKIS